jgi:hypothetical protein
MIERLEQGLPGTETKQLSSLLPDANEMETPKPAKTWDEYQADIDAADRLELVRQNHPLLKFVPLDGEPKAPEWIIPGFISEGVLSIAGMQGIGKSTSIFPLALIAAGLIDGELSPGECWRHVLYASEDVEQIKRIAAGLVRAGLVDPKLMDERIRLVQAVRTSSGELVVAGQLIAIELTRFVGSEPIKPLVVLDTKSACLDSEDENSNSETSRIVADLKQRFDGLPVWLVGHVSKANFGRSDIDGMSTRGASSLEGDVQQTMFMIREGDTRWLVAGKTRFEARYRELRIDSHLETMTVRNRFGQDEVLALRFGIPSVPDVPRADAAKAAKDEAKQRDHADLRQQVLVALRAAQARGDRLNASRLRETLGRKVSAVLQAITELVNERWITEVFVPSNIRTHPKRDTFLFALTTEQHDQVVLDGHPMPPESAEIPASWTKAGSGTVGNR